MKSAMNGLSEMFPVGCVHGQVSVPSFPCHSGRTTVPSTLPFEPIMWSCSNLLK